MTSCDSLDWCFCLQVIWYLTDPCQLFPWNHLLPSVRNTTAFLIHLVMAKCEGYILFISNHTFCYLQWGQTIVDTFRTFFIDDNIYTDFIFCTYFRRNSGYCCGCGTVPSVGNKKALKYNSYCSCLSNPR